MSFWKLDYCIQGQSHSDGSICERMFIWMISSELLNILLPILVWWCSTMSQNVMQKEKSLLFSASQQGLIWSKYDSFFYIFSTVDSLAMELCLMIHRHKPCVLWKTLDYCIDGHNEGSNVNVCEDDDLINCQTVCYQTWYCDASSWAGMHAKRLVYCFRGPGHSKGLYDQNMTVSTISSELLILLLPNLVW